MSRKPDALGPLDAAGWLGGVECMPSPNCDDRPAGVVPQLVVIHAISLPPGEFGGPAVLDLFANRLDPDAHPYFAALAGRRVSAHFLIRRDGWPIQFVSCAARAWHAGASCWRGRERCNDFSLGIELEGDDFSPFEPVQYVALEALIAALRRHFPLAAAVGHADVAPARKTDPGPRFDWSRIAAIPLA